MMGREDNNNGIANMKQIVAIAADHAAYEYKQRLIKELSSAELEFLDYGTNSNDSVDYPDYAVLVGNAVMQKKATCGILLCGTGIGMSIAANKIKGIRAALCHTPEEAQVTRQHNHANVLAMGARTNDFANCKAMTQEFLTTAYSEDERHLRRLAKIASLEA